MGSRAGHVVLQDARGSVSDPYPRSNDDLITRKLEKVWPSVSARLRVMLERRGVSSHDAEEAIQETAARAMSAAVEFADADDLFRWASVVSWRVAVDARRRCTRVSGNELPERADHVDVAQAAETRIVLSAVTTRFKELSERDRAVLLAGLDEQPSQTRLESVRTAVARHRARNRLRGLLNGLAAPVVAFIVRRRWRSAHAEAFVSTAGPALACFALTVGAVGGVPPQSPVQPATVIAASISPSAPVIAVAGPTGSAPSTAGTQHTASPTLPPAGTTGVRIEAVPGQPTRADVRPKQASDHLWCVTLPSLSGPATTCLDTPSPAH